MTALASYEAVREACFQRIMADGVLYEAAPDKRALVIQNVVGQYLYEMRAQLTRQERERLVRELVQDILAYGPITPLLDDERVTEIMVNGPSQVYVERDGRIELTDVRFRDDAHVRMVIDRIVAPLGRRVDEASPMVDARLPDGSRVNAIIPPVSLVGPVITIRRFVRRRLGAEELVRTGSLSRPMVEFLRTCVEGRRSVLVSGGTGSGKTTVLNMLSRFIPAEERIITIEDVAELQLQHPHWIRLETRPANTEGKGEVTARDLVRNALRMRPDRIILGEVRGAEAFEMIQALNTGHEGGMSTLHANTAEDALVKLANYVRYAFDLPVAVINAQIASAIDLVVHVHRFPDGRRRVVAVVEVLEASGEHIVTAPIFEFRPDLDGGGRHVWTGHRPRVLEELRRRGLLRKAPELEEKPLVEAAV